MDRQGCCRRFPRRRSVSEFEGKGSPAGFSGANGSTEPIAPNAWTWALRTRALTLDARHVHNETRGGADRRNACGRDDRHTARGRGARRAVHDHARAALTLVGNAVGVGVPLCSGGQLARVADRVEIAVGLAGVGDRVAVVDAVGDSVAIGVSVDNAAAALPGRRLGRVARATVAAVTSSVAVAVVLRRVEGAHAVVTHIAPAVVIRIGLAHVCFEWAIVLRVENCVVVIVGIAYVPGAIAVRIDLAGVCNTRAVVARRGNLVRVSILRGQTTF